MLEPRLPKGVRGGLGAHTYMYAYIYMSQPSLGPFQGGGSGEEDIIIVITIITAHSLTHYTALSALRGSLRRVSCY